MVLKHPELTDSDPSVIIGFSLFKIPIANKMFISLKGNYKGKEYRDRKILQNSNVITGAILGQKSIKTFYRWKKFHPYESFEEFPPSAFDKRMSTTHRIKLIKVIQVVLI